MSTTSACENCEGRGYYVEYVTREMAHDAGDPTMEGHEQRFDCHRCDGLGFVVVESDDNRGGDGVSHQDKAHTGALDLVTNAIGRALQDQAEGERIMATHSPGSHDYECAKLGIALARFRQAMWETPAASRLVRFLVWLSGWRTRR